jgi:hypothetical protein
VAGRAASPGPGQQVGGGPRGAAAGLLHGCYCNAAAARRSHRRERAQIGSLVRGAGTAFLLYNHEQWAVYS